MENPEQYNSLHSVVNREENKGGFIRNAINADEVTDQFSNKEILLLCLRYVTYQNGLPVIHEAFFNSLHINGRPTGPNIGKKILFLLEKNKIDIEKSRAQAYDGASAMSSNSSEGAVIKNSNHL